MITQLTSPFNKVPQDFQYETSSQAFRIEVTKVGKKNQQRYLQVHDKFLLLFKESNYVKPHKIFHFVFDSKFEVFRDPPILKSTVSKTTKPEAIKPEDIQKMGAIISIKFFTEGSEIFYEIAGGEPLQRLRLHLANKINQIGFHHMFKVFKKIGKGNFASVYLAERIEDGTQMAIKAFSKTAVFSEENGKEGLVNEITLMRQFDSDHIMKLYEVYETQNSLYMGLELLEGGQLYEYLKKKVIFQNKEIQIIMKGLLLALKHMHSKEIMHRDIKLENILFKKANDIESVILADFGLATYVNEPIYLYCRCGTPGFVAPEVINITDMSTRYDLVCDVYSLGLVFHILLTGKPAFPGRSYNTIVQQNKEAQINFKSKVFEVVAPMALELLKKMLEQDPKKRMTADQALRHQYLQPVMQNVLDVTVEENIDENDDQSDLTTRIDKINEETQRFDMLRINQFTQSPIQSPMVHANLRSIRPLEGNDMVMKTPIMTGRIQSVEASPQVMNQLGRSPQQGSRVLQQYANKPKEIMKPQQVQQEKEESKDSAVKNVKSNLSKNI